MALVDYSHDPATGLYEFRDDAGASRMAFGGEAEELARFVDERRRSPMLAQNMSGGDSLMSTMDAGSSTAPPQAPPMMSDVGPQMSSGPEPSMGPPPGIARPGMPPSPGQAAQQVADQGPVESPQNPLLTPEGTAAFALSPVYQGGRAAFNPKAYDASLAPVRTGGATTVQGMLPETEEQVQQRLNDERRRRSAFETALQNTEAAHEERIAAHEEAKWQHQVRALDAQEQVKERERRIAEVDRNGKQLLSRLETDRANIRSNKIDQHRIFRTKDGGVNAGAVIMSALAQGLGAFGASMTGSRNFAADLIENAIQRDVASQEADRESERDRIDNALARFERFYGLDRQEARMALEVAQRDYVAANASALAASIGTAEAKTQAATIVADMLARNAQTEAQLRELYGGRITTQEQMQFMAPQAGSRGGLRAPTAKEIGERADAISKLRKATGGEMEPEQLNAKRQQQQDELSRRVTLDTGDFAYATTKERADKAQMQLDAAMEYRKNVSRQREILNRAGDSVDPELKQEYDAIVQRNTLLLKETEDLGAITEADATMVQPLTGAGGQDFWRWKSGVLAASKAAEQHVGFRMRSAQKQLFREPTAQTLVSPTEESVGIKVGR